MHERPTHEHTRREYLAASPDLRSDVRARLGPMRALMSPKEFERLVLELVTYPRPATAADRPPAGSVVDRSIAPPASRGPHDLSHHCSATD